MREVRSMEQSSAFVLGAPLFMVRRNKDALGFLSRHRKALLKRWVLVFALGPVGEACVP